MNREAGFDIATQLTAMEVYPHRGSYFHLCMGVITIIGIIPLSVLLFPVMVISKLLIYSVLYVLFRNVGKKTAFKNLWDEKNRLLLYFHYLIYKIFYIYTTIWWNSIPGVFYDDYWYGLDISTYSDYDDYLASYRNSRVRWRFKKKLKSYAEEGIDKEFVNDDRVFYKVLFSREIFKLIFQSSLRKNNEYSLFASLYVAMRDYFLLLFLPVRVHVYRKGEKIIGLSSYLMRGNTLVMCQHIIADDYTRSGLFYEQMNDLLKYAFSDSCVRYVSCSITTGQAKQTCGFYPVNYLLTDEFEYKPFAYIHKPFSDIRNGTMDDLQNPCRSSFQY